MIERRLTKAGNTRYEVRLRTPDGDERSKTFRTLREAKTYETAELSRRNRGDWIDPRLASTPFREVAAEWLDSNPAKRESTWVRDEIVVRRQLLPRFGSTPINRIDKGSIQQWVNIRSAERAPRTVKREFGVLRAVLAYAVDLEMLGRSPCRKINLPELQPVVRVMPTADGLDLLADELDPGQAPMVYVGAALGLRWGEVAGMRVGHLDLLRGEVSVTEQIVRGVGGRSAVNQPKSHAGRRTMTMPKFLVEMLAEHLHQRGLTAADANEYLFVWPSGGHLTYSAWLRGWKKALRRAGLPIDLGFHDLRRVNATGLVADGVDIRTAQARLGHSDVRLTLEIYAQATNEADRAAAERLDQRFAPRKRKQEGA